MSNCKVSMTRTWWPRFSAAATSACVLYRFGPLERMTIRIGPPPLVPPELPPGFPHQVLLADVDDEIPLQRLAPQDHAEAHPGAVGDRQWHPLGDRAQAERRFDQRPLLAHAVGIADHDHLEHRHRQLAHRL